jgi:hypothetical protein
LKSGIAVLVPTRKVQESSPFGSAIDPAVSESSARVKLVPDFLPSPEELAPKNEQSKVTVSLSSDSVTFFKEAAKKHHT